MTIRTALTLAALAAPVLLSACAEKKAPPPCPPIYILSDAATVTKYRPGPGRDLTDVDVEAEIVGYQGNCSYDDKGAVVSLQVKIDAKRGPGNATRKADLQYFVAIPRYFPAPEAKAVLPVTVEFPSGANMVRFTDEEVVMRIPVQDKDLIDKYEIYLGFQTSADELENNRRAKK